MNQLEGKCQNSLFWVLKFNYILISHRRSISPSEYSESVLSDAYSDLTEIEEIQPENGDQNKSRSVGDLRKMFNSLKTDRS